MTTFTKPTKKMERKPDEDANVDGNTNAKPALPALPASFKDKTASSEKFSAKSIKNSDAISISTETKPSEMDSVPPASFVNETVPSEDIYFDASDKKTPSEDISNATNAPVIPTVNEKTNETKSKEPAPPMPPVPESAPSKNISVLTNSLTTASVAEPARTAMAAAAAAATVKPTAVNKTDSEGKRAPMTLPHVHLNIRNNT
jgi:hypothetical protein